MSNSSHHKAHTKAPFIVLEGIEGAGKSTQMATVQAACTAAGFDSILTREPGGTPLAERIRDLLLGEQSESVPPNTELLLMFAARAAHLANKVIPALEASRAVISDRFTDASFAYQGAGRGVPESDIAALERMVQGDLQPDLVLLFDLPVDVALERVAARGNENHFDQESGDFFERAREVYLRRAQAASERYVLIDAAAELDTVTRQVELATVQCLERWA